MAKKKVTTASIGKKKNLADVNGQTKEERDGRKTVKHVKPKGK